METIRNFCILAHIDNGKSTLADRFLELTNTIPREKMRPQYLDTMDLERERGITIKMAPVRMNYTINAVSYTLNLIDTPGHVDFSYEVSRALAAVEGVVLLVDATKGIQAQTIANLQLAKKQHLVIIPAVNKIDLAHAKIKETKAEIVKILNFSENEIFEISAKYGTNVKELLETIIKKIPPPASGGGGGKTATKKPLRALIFDSKYDTYKGTIAFVRIFEGEIRPNEKIFLISTKTEGETKEVGYFSPELSPCREITAGEIGYIATGIKEPGKVRVGDTITKAETKNIDALPGYKEPQPMVFVSFYPQDPDDFGLLKEALVKLKLNDASFNFEPERKESLGRGFCCSFLGQLHAEIISERLFREYNLNLIISAPSVNFSVINKNNEEISVNSPGDWPAPFQIKEVREPWVQLEVMTPQVYLGRVLEVLKNLHGKYIKTEYFSLNRIILIYEAPLREMVNGFYDRLKGVSEGYASMSYHFLEYRPADLVKLEILIAGKKEEAFSKIVPRQDAYLEGKRILLKLKEILPRQLFAVPLQAVISGKIIARETIGAKGKDVIAPLYGGDYTRKRKLLERQKRGKQELKKKGIIRIPQKVFFEMFKS